MKKILSVSLFFFWFIISTGQTGWVWRNPLPQGNPLHSISFLRDYGMAVGEGGTVLHTSDGGENWRMIDLGVRQNLNSVVMHDDLMAFIAGDNGLLIWVMYHVDSDSFEVRYFDTETSDRLNAVTSHINNCPWVAGNNGFVLRSSDFGQSWERQNAFYNFDLFDLDNIECTEVWASGVDGAVIYSSDLGVSWQYRGVTTPWDLYSVNVGTFENIRVCGQQGSIWRTSDKGLTWNLEYEEPGYNLYSIENVGLNAAYAAGGEGVILETLDYGDSWEKMNTGLTSTLYDIFYHGLGYDRTWAVGYYGSLLVNSGVGTDFEIQNRGTFEWFFSVDFVNQDTGWAVGGDPGWGGNRTGLICRTVDGGKTWQQQYHGDLLFNEVDFVNDTTGWVVGDDGEVRKTVNGGESWIRQETPISTDLFSLSFPDEKNGWAVSKYAEIIHTSNGGNTWTKQSNPSLNPLHDVFFVNENLGFAAGLDSTILRTKDGGENWNQMILKCKNNYRFSSLFFINEEKGWATGVTGSILLTEDGGDSWQEIESTVGENIILEDVFFIDEKNGWISGDRGTILRSVDGGHTWFRQESGVSVNYLAGIRFTDLSHGCAVGEGGTIITTDNGGFAEPYGTIRHPGLNLPINDHQLTVDSILLEFESDNRITGLEVFIDSIIHSRVSDIEIYIVHDDITDTIFRIDSQEGENLLWMVLNDDAPLDLNGGVPPFSGIFIPYNPLSVFNGRDPSGKWELQVYDREEGHTGSLVSWGLKPYYFQEQTTDVSEFKDGGSNIFYGNYPNPVTDNTRIMIRLDRTEKVVINLYDITGRKAAVLFEGDLQAGYHEKIFNMEGFQPGFYIYSISTESGNSDSGLLIKNQ